MSDEVLEANFVAFVTFAVCLRLVNERSQVWVLQCVAEVANLFHWPDKTLDLEFREFHFMVVLYAIKHLEIDLQQITGLLHVFPWIALDKHAEESAGVSNTAIIS